MPAARNPRHLQRRNKSGSWWARKGIPTDLRHAFGGKKWFVANTSETDPNRAAAVAGPILAEWERRIEHARQSHTDPMQAEIDRLAAAFRKYREKPLDDAGAALVADVVEFVLERIGGLTADQRRAALTKAKGDVETAIQALPKPERMQNAIGRITATATPFLSHIAEWKEATHVKGKTLDQYESGIRRFAAMADKPREKLTGGDVQRWIETMLHEVKPKTLHSYLAGLRSYWGWMQSHDLIPEDHRPFSNRKVIGSQTAAEHAEELPDRFEPKDVVRLWRAAKADSMLYAIVKIGAYSGIRREGICQLRKSSIHTDPETNIRFMHVSEKSEAGVRDVPVHLEIAGLIDALVKGADRDGYLIHVNSADRYGQRGDALGKRFTRLKRKLGFGDRHVFHSIRHCVAHLFETAECPEGVAQDIIGHVKRGLTYGLYSGVTKLDHRAAWLEKAIRYPKEPRAADDD
jgi:integrase